MKMEKRSVKLPPTLATEDQARRIRRHLFDAGKSYSTYALEAVLERLDREQQPEPTPPYVRGAR